ncbi:MAG: type I DNA topoisomerase [Muribaculaceae bacterium]|nr:type I DNA topoisomerase [Muribaculaceae bacterium]MDE6551981.1 type I DNA topoisomerase [Muribaculaceae bacterium]
MMNNLVIVESPAKAKTIEKFLGKGYTVLSSYGHIRDLKKKGIAIDFDNDFAPEYEIPADKKDTVRKLKEAARNADMVWLASDEDREGEAIAWHLYEVLGLKPANTKRIVFHEITKPAILNAIANPRDIDLDRVNAQQARRVLDRIVGFELSPVLWKKIKPSLSAGRVQSVAVRLICEREKEIMAFTPESYFRVSGLFDIPGSTAGLKADLSRRCKDEKDAMDVLSECHDASFRISEVNVRPGHRQPYPPFTTSTLQQEASRRLGFSVNQTMVIAQKLYEDGKITYMRTDSTNLSELALRDISDAIRSNLGEQYLKVRHYHTHSKGAQEAHEAIRPTYVSNRTIEGDAKEQKLYDLIWRRAVASQMADAEIEKTTVDIAIIPDQKKASTEDTSHGVFKAEGEVVVFPGFLSVYQAGAGKDTSLPPLSVGMDLTPQEITATEDFTQAPPRYSEASLVKKMEELGIGRPSTYAPTISTIQQREYVKRGEKEGAPRDFKEIILKKGKITMKTKSLNAGSEKGKLVPTDTGMVVNDFLTEYFPDILDYNFTAKIEEKFDDIAEGKLPWQNEMSEFYGAFHPEIEKINTLKMEHKVGERELGVDPKTGRTVYVKIGRFGPIAQIGEATDEDKPLFASLQPDQSVQTITLEEALKLFELPRDVGSFEGKKILAAVGRFGPYIRHDSMFVSIPKDMSPLSITESEAIELIEKKRAEEANKFIKSFPERPEIEILNGRYGPYFTYLPEGAKKKINYKIPKGTDPMSLTLDDVLKLIEQQDAAPKKRPSARTKKK